MSKIIVYSAQLCSDCQYLKKWLDEQNIEYETRDIHFNPQNGIDLEKQTGKLGVPYFKLGEDWVRAYRPGEMFSADWVETTLKSHGVL
jgi:glutaredoxin-like protein NrdH